MNRATTSITKLPRNFQSKRCRVRLCQAKRTTTIARLRGVNAFPEGDSNTNEEDQVITIFGCDGTVTAIPSLPHRFQSLERLSLRPDRSPLPTVHEQGLCIPSIFTISATNGVDTTRRVNLHGFCLSLEILCDNVEEAVVMRGGEVFVRERRVALSGVHEYLHMTVAIPLLFGVPPEYERLKKGIKTGGGIIEKVYREWLLC